MNKLLLIQIISLVLCISMTIEIGIPLEDTIQVSAEADHETEHEENKEDNKEKTTYRPDDLVSRNGQILTNNALISNSQQNWISPTIDSLTPPPELF